MNLLLDLLCENTNKSHRGLNYQNGTRNPRHGRQSSQLRRSVKRKTCRLTLVWVKILVKKEAVIASEVFEESLGPMEKHECPSLLDLKLESEEAAEIAMLP